MISPNERGLYEYAAYCFLLSLFPFLYVLVIGGIIGLVAESACMIVPFVFIRKFSGGYHAKYLWLCLIQSCVVMTAFLAVVSHIAVGAGLRTATCIVAFFLMFLSPVDSKNRRLSEDERKACKKVVIAMTLIFFVFFEILCGVGLGHYAKYVAAGIILCFAVQCMAVLQFCYQKRVKNVVSRKKD